jgi:hypothetical protein
MKATELKKLIREEIHRVLNEGLTFEELATKLEQIPFDGNDFTFSQDDDIIYVEVLSGGNKKAVLLAIQAILKENPAYKIDPESKEKTPDGSVQFSIIKK